MDTGNKNNFALYMRYKKKDLKWYQKFWNYITGHKDRNYHWMPVDSALENGGFNE